MKQITANAMGSHVYNVGYPVTTGLNDYSAVSIITIEVQDSFGKENQFNAVDGNVYKFQKSDGGLQMPALTPKREAS